MNLGVRFLLELPSVAKASPRPPVSLPFHVPPFNSSFHPASCLSLGSPESKFEPHIWMQVVYLGFPSGSKESEREEGEKSRGWGMELLNVMGSCPLGPSEARVRDV